MPLETPARPRTALTTELALPPPFSAVRLREVGDAFAHAISIAGEHGAGTLVYVGRFDLAEFALVLEPDEPLLSARRAFYAGMAALAEALAAHAQPDTSVTIDWPGSLLVNQGLVGGGRLAWPRDLEEDQTPEWLVFGGMVRTVSMSGLEPGLNPLVTALEEEGFTDVMSSQLLESFARNFMRIVDSWQENGFGAVAKNYIGRMPGEQGVRRDIDENGDLMIRRVGKVEATRQKFLPRLVQPAWFDPATRGPRA
jgi:biotin-(acetyl-CoA carboxylase) ligase